MSVASIDAEIAQVHARIEYLRQQIILRDADVVECTRQLKVQEGILEEQTKRRKGFEDLYEGFTLAHNKFVNFQDGELTRYTQLSKHSQHVRFASGHTTDMQGFLKNGTADGLAMQNQSAQRKMILEAELALDRANKAKQEIERLDAEIRRLKADIDRMHAEIKSLEGRLGALYAARAAAAAEEARQRAAAAAASSSKSSSGRR
ncbi:MAG: hypothetical protein LBR44_11240 [Clostridiales Family XIII bacterium]|jgi:predicted  nucleic acid-binding Zn-ribbon protein|nr:hypothetical protein [Clostridiales Family XIII bacterium]